jgi:hypothetical protein
MVINEYREDAARLLAKGKKASEFILKTYSLEKEERGVVNFWKEIERNRSIG